MVLSFLQLHHKKIRKIETRRGTQKYVVQKKATEKKRVSTLETKVPLVFEKERTAIQKMVAGNRRREKIQSHHR